MAEPIHDITGQEHSDEGWSGKAQAANLEAVPEPQGQFESLTAEQQGLEVSRAMALLEAAESAELKLSAVDVTEVLGYEDPGRVSKIWDKAKEHLPGLKSRRERFTKAVDSLHEQANWENEERDQQAAADNWLTELSPDEAAGLHIDLQGSGVNMLQPLRLTTAGETGKDLDLGRMIAIPESVKAQLSDEERAFLETRQDYWKSLKVEHGPGADKFVEEHFEQLSIDLKGDMPPEVEWLLTQHPEAREQIEQMQAAGIQVDLQKAAETPDSVLDAIRHVAVKSQHKFVSTWLPRMLLKDDQPRVLESDRRSITEGYERLQTANQELTTEGGFRRKLVTELFDEHLARDIDFDHSIEMIRTFSHDVLALNAHGDLSQEQRDQIELLNGSLADGLGREYSRRRLISDDAARNSEGAQKIIKSLAVLGPTVEIMQESLHLGGIAKFLAASGDDIASETAELSALKGAGMTREELTSRLKILGPAAVVAMGAASMIDRVEKTVNPRVAGVLFSSSAVLLSAVTGALSIKYFADNYKELAAEGKLEGRFAANPQVLERINALDSESISPDEVIATVEEALEAAGSTGNEHEEMMTHIRELIKTNSIEDVIAASQSPNVRERYVAGLKEAAAVNPARLGLTVGTYTSPIVGALFGPIFLTQPLLYAVAGSYETIAGATSIWMYNKTFDMRWNHYINKQQGPAPEMLSQQTT